MSVFTALGRASGKATAIAVSTIGIGLAAIFAATAPAAAANLSVCATGCDASTIQGAINAASAGDTIYVAAGTYTENITIDKHLHLVGAGSAADTGTVIASATANTPVVKITKSGVGTSAADLLTLEGVRLTGATGAGNLGAGVLVAAAEAQSNIKIDNVVVTGNGGDGIGLNNTVSVTNFNVTNSTVTLNTGAGLRVATAVLAVDGYNVSDSTISSNGGSGLSVNPSQSDRNQTNFNFTDVNFTDNNTTNVENVHQVSLLGFKGNATLTRVNISGAWPGGAAAGGHGLVVSGLSGYGALGTIVLDDVNITGAVKKGGILFQKYSNVAGLSMTDVDVSGVTAPWGQVIFEHTSATPANIGNTTLKTAGVWGVGGINATSANFKSVATGAALTVSNDADAFTASAQVVDRMDAAVIGVISLRAGHQYVTPVNALTGTTAGPLARAVAVSASGETLHVAPGTYTESVVVNKPLTLLGAQTGVNPSSSGRAGGESQLTGAIPVSITSDNVTVDGFEFTSFNTAIAIPAPFSGAEYLRDNVTISRNWIHDAAMDFGIEAAPGTLSDLTIDRNILAKTELQSGELIHFSEGTSAEGAGHKLTNLVITNNELSAAGDKAILNQTGLATSEIDGLTMTGNWIHGALSTASNLWFTNVRNATITNNHIDGVTVSGAFKSSTISGNNFVGGSTLELLGAASGRSFAAGDLKVEDNNFANLVNSQLLVTDYAATADGYFTVRDNSFTSDSADTVNYRVNNTGAAGLELAYNWWGQSTGPAASDLLNGVSTTTPHLTGYVVDPAKATAPASWPLSGTGLAAAPGFWPTEKTYVVSLPAGTTSAAVELEQVGAIDLGLIASETPVEISVGDLVDPDLTESPFVVGDGALFELVVTGIAPGTPVEICVTSATPALLWHYELGAWVNITTSYDASTGRLCGSTLNFSPFAVAPEKTDTVASIEATIGGNAATSSVFGQTVVFDASIDQTTATGTLTVTIDGVLETTCSANSLLGCLPSRSNLTAGNHTIELSYDGDDDFKPSTATLSWTVDKADVTSAAGVTPLASTHGDTVTMTGSYSGPSGATGPTGTVSFYVDGQTADDLFSTCTLSSGTCSETVSDLPAGTHTIYLSYGGDSNYNEKSESFEVTVAKADIVSLYAGLDAVAPTYGDNFKFTAEIYGAVNGALPTGTVSFYLDPAGDNTLIGTCTLSGRVCDLAAGSIAAGNHTVKVTFPGDTNYNSAEDTYDFSVAKASAPVVTPKTITQAFGTAAPASLYTVTGLVGSESLDTLPTCLLYAASDTAHEGTGTALSASTTVGSYLLYCSGAAASANYEAVTYGADGVVTINKAPALIDYTGVYYLGAGSASANLQATVTGVCAPGAPVRFSYDANGDGSYETLIANVTANGSGVATFSWTLPTGVALFDIEASFTSTDCDSVAASATLVIGSSGDSSNGGGWYNLNGKMSFGYVTQTKVVKTVSTTTGQIVWNSKNGTKFKGTINSYKIVACGTGLTGKCAAISGSGYVSTLDTLTGVWTKSTTLVSFSAKVLDGGTSTVCSTVKKVTTCTTTAKPDFFSINISNYVIVGESNTLVQLKGGNIVVK